MPEMQDRHEGTAHGPFRSTMVYRLEGPYSYEREEEPEVLYKRFIGYQNIDEWVEHALQLVTPYTRVRITVEVIE